jgi:hypothetical protein
MLVFYAFLVICFTGGFLFARINSTWRAIGLFGLCGLIVFAYFFLHRL